MKNLVIIIISFVIGIFAGIYSRKYFFSNGPKLKDYVTDTVYDTIRIGSPRLIASNVTDSHVSVTVSSRDVVSSDTTVRSVYELDDNKASEVSETRADSITLQLPITQNVYADSTYTAYVSGVSPRLDSIFVYPRREIVTKTIKKPPNRWHIGVTAGYGFTPKNGPQPFVGVGVTYSLFSF